MSPRRIRSPMPTFSAKKLSTSTKGRDFPFLSAQFWFSCHCDGSLVWRPGFKPCLGQAVPSTAKQQSHDHRIDVPTTRTLSYDCICCQEALDWRKWTKGGCSFPFFVCTVWSTSHGRSVALKWRKWKEVGCSFPFFTFQSGPLTGIISCTAFVSPSWHHVMRHARYHICMLQLASYQKKNDRGCRITADSVRICIL